MGLEGLEKRRPGRVNPMPWASLARLWGVSERSVYYWKSGQWGPTRARKEMVAKTFRCKVEDIWPDEKREL